jgi:hypothetical protein
VVEVKDDILPVIDPLEDTTVHVSEEIWIIVMTSDNIGIVSFEWDGAPIEAVGNQLKGYPAESGTYQVSVTVRDAEDNIATTEFVLLVLPQDHDEDSDGIPDLVEEENGLDPLVPGDALLDEDMDGLTNIEEFRNGTDILGNDTDRDGMPDGWEVLNGLDPLTYSPDNDADGDGRSDLEEYLDGTDPQVENKNSPGILVVILIVAAVLLVLTVLAGVGTYLYLRRMDLKDGPRPLMDHQVSGPPGQQSVKKDPPPLV